MRAAGCPDTPAVKASAVRTPADEAADRRYPATPTPAAIQILEFQACHVTRSSKVDGRSPPRVLP